METLVLLVVFGLVNFGLFFICGLSAISLPIRRRMPPLVIELLECPGCFGFWTGLALATLAVASGLVSLPPSLHFAFKILTVLAGGVASSASNLLFYSLSGIPDREAQATWDAREADASAEDREAKRKEREAIRNLLQKVGVAVERMAPGGSDYEPEHAEKV